MTPFKVKQKAHFGVFFNAEKVSEFLGLKAIK